MPAKSATTVRFSTGELHQIDRLKRKWGFATRADVIRYAVITKRQRDAAKKEQ